MFNRNHYIDKGLTMNAIELMDDYDSGGPATVNTAERVAGIGIMLINSDYPSHELVMRTVKFCADHGIELPATRRIGDNIATTMCILIYERMCEEIDADQEWTDTDTGNLYAETERFNEWLKQGRTAKEIDAFFETRG